MQQWIEKVTQRDPVDTALLLTLILVALSPGDSLALQNSMNSPGGPIYASGPIWIQWMVLIGSGILAITGLLSRELRHSPRLWVAIGSVLFVGNVWVEWHFSDNHKFLICYWCFAIAILLQLPDKQSALEWTGRILVGLVMGIATLWKATSLGYLDGSMFQYLLVTDERFFAMANFLTGFTAEQYTANQEILKNSLAKPIQWVPTIEFAATVPLQTADSIPALATFLTWWTILIEGGIAALFLIERGEKWTKWRHLVLILFMLTTYPPTGVIKFGWILVILAMASLPEAWRKTRAMYLFAFLYIFFFAEDFLRRAYFSAMQ